MLLLGALAFAGPLTGQSIQDRPNAEEAERAIAQLRSPYCPGVMLEVCTSYGGAMLRDSIYQLAAEGMTSDELVEWMLSRHGEEYRAVPPRTGFGLFSWIVPPAILMLGLAGVTLWLRAHRAPEPAVAEAASELSETDRATLTAALRAWEDSGEEEV
jgi:cytochrome c-type biogenesis protein CcmH/NrfF